MQAAPALHLVQERRMKVRQVSMCVFHYSGRLRQPLQNSVWCIVITLHSARRMVNHITQPPVQMFIQEHSALKRLKRVWSFWKLNVALLISTCTSAYVPLHCNLLLCDGSYLYWSEVVLQTWTVLAAVKSVSTAESCGIYGGLTILCIRTSWHLPAMHVILNQVHVQWIMESPMY